MSSSNSTPPGRAGMRPIGSGVPLGLFGLAVASFVFAGLELGAISSAESTVVGAIVLVLAVPLGTIATLSALAARDGGTGTSMGVMAGAWGAVGVALLLLTPGATSEAFGWLLLALAGALLLSAAGSGRLIIGLIAALLGARFMLSGLYEVTAAGGVQEAAGVVGLVVSALAGGAALVLQAKDAGRSGPAVPARRVDGGVVSLNGAADQVAELVREPGAREDR